MAFQVLFVVRAPGSDPAKDRSALKAAGIEVTTVAFELDDSEGILRTCKAMVEEQGIHAVVLCPAVSNDLIARLDEEVGEKAAIFVGRGDFRSVHLASQATMREWT